MTGTTKFQDAAKREWSLALNIRSARRVRDQLQVDLLAKDFAGLIERLFGDSILLCDVLFVVADENAAPAQRVTDEEFGRAMNGDAIEQGGMALLNALRDFIPSPQARARVDRIIAAIEQQMKTMNERADRALDTVLKRFEQEATGLTSSASQESPALSRGDTRSAS